MLLQGAVLGVVLLLGAGLVVFVLQPLQQGGRTKD
jgi:hypothetical protein